MKTLISVFLICFAIGSIQNAKILGIFPAPSKSHYILSSSLMNALADKGHNVTFITSFENKNPAKNWTYREIILTGWVEKAEEYTQKLNMFHDIFSNNILARLLIRHGLLTITDKFFNHTNVQKLIHSNETFDVVIMEQIMNEAHHGLANHFNAPLIVFGTVGACDLINELVGNPSPLSYIPHNLLMYSNDMTFFERFKNFFVHLLITFIRNVYFLPQQAKILRKHLPNSPNITDALYNTSLVLLNSHPSINQPVPFVPNMIDIGGFHVKSPKKLPKDLQEFLDSAKDGVIYFSMGSSLKSTQLPLNKRKVFLKAFSKLKQKVLWKWEDDELPEKPDNVKIAKWLPQQDILAHPNIKLFVNYGGLLSIIETIYHGVPILAIPIVNDQKINAARAVNDGYGLILAFSDITERRLSEKIKELLDNLKYRNAAEFRSKIFHDQQVKPMDKAIYWIEYIARHGGADHLKVAGLKFPWYKYHLLDVISFVFVIIITTIILLFLLIKNMCFANTSKSKQE